METIYVELIDSSEKIPFNMSYGIHRELQEYLMQTDNLFKLFNDITVSDTVIKIALSERNAKGQVIKEFDSIALVTAESINELLDYIFQYFSEFFLKNQEKIKNLSNQIAEISKQSQDS